MTLLPASVEDPISSLRTVRRPLVVANWKMNGTSESLAGVRRIAETLRGRSRRARVAICPPATLIDRLAHAIAGFDIEVGGQDVHPQTHGAFTGEISAPMLRDAGARLVIVGHSERRLAHGETDAVVAQKARAALDAGLTPVICIGESEKTPEVRSAVDAVVLQALACIPAGCTAETSLYLAYEPRWAIGSDRTPTPDEIQLMHTSLHGALQTKVSPNSGDTGVLYGGSVTPDNASTILGLASVDGLLVGRAALEPQALLSLLAALEPVDALSPVGPAPHRWRL